MVGLKDERLKAGWLTYDSVESLTAGWLTDGWVEMVWLINGMVNKWHG